LPSLRETSIYLIGSGRTRNDPADLDLVIVYDPTQVSSRYALFLRNELATTVEGTFGLSVDICLLSTSEADQSQFLEEERAVLIR